MHSQQERLHRKTPLPRLVAVNLLMVVVLVAAVELTTRLVSWASGDGFFLSLEELPPYHRQLESIYQWHPFCGVILRPGSRITSGHPNQGFKATVEVDDHGFLSGPDGLTQDKPAGELRLAFIGASTTANLNLAFAQNWPGQLARLVQAHAPGRTVRVINAAVPGFDTAQSIANLALRVMPFAPDVVVIYHAYNDLKATRRDGRFAPDYGHIHPRPFGYHPRPAWPVQVAERSMFFVRTRHRYREMRKARRYAQGRDRSAATRRRDRVLDLAEAAFGRNVRTLAAIARAGGARVVLCSFATLHDPTLDWRDPGTIARLTAHQRRNLVDLLHFVPGLTLPAIFDGLQRYNRLLAATAAELNTGWVDNARLIPHQDAYFVDRVHFTPRGARKMSENLLPAVLDAMGAG